MHRLLSFFCITAACIGLVACATDVQPVISFVGMATGTLVTDLNALRFNTVFGTTDTNIVGVVGFTQVQEGTTVQATWFSPDERHMPLGRTSIVTQSGATIARFSFASKEPWAKAPYMLRIDAFRETGGKMLTASGSAQFFIGMTDEEIAAYRKEFEEWNAVETAKRQEWEQEQAAFQQFLGKVRLDLGYKKSNVLLRTDLTGDRQDDYLIADKADDHPPAEEHPGTLFSSTTGAFAIVDHSGAILLNMKQKGSVYGIESFGKEIAYAIPVSDQLQLTILPSASVSLYWPQENKICFAEFEPLKDGGYERSREGCR